MKRQGIKNTQEAIELEREMQETKAAAIADGTFMKAPNGKPTNLDERQWLLTRTKAFKEKFGDWVNNPDGFSEKLDKNGEPLITNNKDIRYSLEDYSILDDAIKTGNWTDEALDTLDNLNNEDYGRILKRFSQKELGSCDGTLKQAATIIARGSTQANIRDTQAYNGGRAKQQEQEIESWAKENGLWYNDYQESTDGSLESVIEADGGVLSPESGSESMVFVTANPSKEGLIKAIDASHYTDSVQGLLDKIILHNSLFPETSYETLGFGRDKGGTFRVIVKQKFVKGTEPTIADINSFIQKLGLEKKGGWYYTKDGKRITDLNPKNIIKVCEDFAVIDCDIEFTKEHLQNIHENDGPNLDP